jgi:hypothetical protein
MAWNFIQKDDGTATLLADGGDSENELLTVEFANNVDVEIGRGDTDTDRTYIAVRRSDGTKVYIFVDTGTTISASTTKP